MFDHNLSMEGFHVRYSEKYVVENSIRQNRIIEHFFFCSPEQFQMARRFVSGCVIETDATFNTNELRMPLSGLIGITNTMSTFPVAHCFITSESTSAFVFINECLKDMFFFDDCPGPAVMLGDFSAGLSQAMLKTIQKSRSEAGMSIAWKLSHELDHVGINCTLQLCSWHAAEAIKKRLITEGYHVDKRKELVNLIWSWIEAPTPEKLAERRSALIAQLRPKEQVHFINLTNTEKNIFFLIHSQEYVQNYYVRQEPPCIYPQTSKSRCFFNSTSRKFT